METQTIIPPNAIEEVWQRWPTGVRQSAFYTVDGERVGFLWWDEEGRLAMEHGIKGDLKSEADNRPYRALPRELMDQASRLCPELLKETDGSASMEEQELIRNSQGRGKE